MRIVHDADGKCLIILKDNDVCSFVGVRPQTRAAHEAYAPRERASLARSVVAAWSGLADSFQRSARFRRGQ